MPQRDCLDTVKQLEQVGVLRALLFLQNGEKMYSGFEEVMSANTWTKARRVLLDLGWLEIEEGKNRAKIHCLSRKGQEVARLLEDIIEMKQRARHS